MLKALRIAIRELFPTQDDEQIWAVVNLCDDENKFYHLAIDGPIGDGVIHRQDEYDIEGTMTGLMLFVMNLTNLFEA